MAKAVRRLNRLGIVNLRVRSGALIGAPRGATHAQNTFAASKVHLAPVLCRTFVYVLDIVKERQKLVGKGPHPQFLLANLPQAGEAVRLEHQKDDDQGADNNEG